MVFEGMTIDEDVFRELKANIVRRLTPQPVRIRADIEVTCFSKEGIDAIKTALNKAVALETEAIPVKVKLVAPPLYVLLTTSTDKEGGIELLGKAVAEIEESIKNAGGNLQVKMKVRLIARVLSRHNAKRDRVADRRGLLLSILHPCSLPAQGRVRDRGQGAGGDHGAGREGECRGRGRRGLGRRRVDAPSSQACLSAITCGTLFVVDLRLYNDGLSACKRLKSAAHRRQCEADEVGPGGGWMAREHGRTGSWQYGRMSSATVGAHSLRARLASQVDADLAPLRGSLLIPRPQSEKPSTALWHAAWAPGGWHQVKK